MANLIISCNYAHYCLITCVKRPTPKRVQNDCIQVPLECLLYQNAANDSNGCVCF